MTRNRSRPPRRSAALLAALALPVAACGGGHRLADFDFAGRTLAVSHFPAPAPELRTSGYSGAGGEDAVSTVLSAGSRILREVEARRAEARLDSAASRLDLAERVADRALERTARYLGARPVEDADAADFILEVDLLSLGLEVGSDGAYLFVAGEAVLLDRATGTEVWAKTVRGFDPLTSDVDGGIVPGDVLTAGALSSVSVRDFQRILERLTDYAGDRIGRELREELRDVRRR